MRNQCSRLCFRLTFSKTIEKKKIFVSKHVYVVNLNPAVITLTFEATIDIHDTVRYNRTWWRSTALLGIISFSTRSKVRISLLGPRLYSFIASSCIPHRIVDIDASPNSSVFTAGSMLTTYPWSETKIF